RLESVYTETYRGFESLPHRHSYPPQVSPYLTAVRVGMRTLRSTSADKVSAQHGPHGPPAGRAAKQRVIPPSPPLLSPASFPVPRSGESWDENPPVRQALTKSARSTARMGRPQGELHSSE